jgi:hypothetical protein
MSTDLIAAFWVAGSLAAVVVGACLVLIINEKNTPKGN